jgi:minor extracellular serine protease Vpr
MRLTILLFSLAALAHAEVVPGRYIVELTGDSVSQHLSRRARRETLRTPEATRRRAAVRAEQSALRSRLGAAVTVQDSVENVSNSLIIEASDAEAARLSRLSGVRRVTPVRTLKRLLDRAVVVNRITEAWDQIGDDKAGEGIKIAIIDTGVDSGHAALRDDALKLPGLFPKTNAATDESFTSNKVIVARSYVNLLARRDSDLSARDRVGHGTALAVAAAGVRTAGPLATIQGVAPRAYIGSYKVFGTPNVNDGATNSAIIKAIDDAVADGMDIINLSIGDDLVGRQEDDPLVDAVDRATAAGVLVVCAAGNNGPDFGTISSPGSARSAITVGATRNDRGFGASVDIEGIGAVPALTGGGAPPAAPVTGPIADAGLACDTLPAGSLTGKVALILRGTCTFEIKLNNAQRAGAIGGLVYATAAAPAPIGMNVGAATLPAEMISHSNGQLLKEKEGIVVTLRFTLGAVPQSYNQLARFSAIGPNVDLSIKPDLVAVGESFYVATQSVDPAGDMFSASGFVITQGTSFSAPLVAGALALLKSARPGLTVDQYRSLLINSATPVSDLIGDAATVQKMGAGQLHLAAALRSQTAVYPCSLSLGANARATGTLRVENLNPTDEIYSLSVEPRNGATAPSLSETALNIAAGKSAEVALELDGTTLAPAAYEGFVRITGATTGTETRVPYWFAVPDKTPAAIPIIAVTATGRRSGQVRNAFYFRVTDAAGIPIAGIKPAVTVQSGDGALIDLNDYDSDSPGLFSVTVRLGPAAGANVFRIEAGEKMIDITITGN